MYVYGKCKEQPEVGADLFNSWGRGDRTDYGKNGERSHFFLVLDDSVF